MTNLLRTVTEHFQRERGGGGVGGGGSVAAVVTCVGIPAHL